MMHCLSKGELFWAELWLHPMSSQIHPAFRPHCGWKPGRSCSVLWHWIGAGPCPRYKWGLLNVESWRAFRAHLGWSRNSYALWTAWPNPHSFSLHSSGRRCCILVSDGISSLKIYIEWMNNYHICIYGIFCTNVNITVLKHLFVLFFFWLWPK